MSKYWRQAYKNNLGCANLAIFAEVDSQGELVTDHKGRVNYTINLDNLDFRSIEKDNVLFPWQNNFLQNKIIMHVDGSAVNSNPGTGGAGIAYESFQTRNYLGYPLGENVTNQQAELEALIMGLQHVQENCDNLNERAVEVCSDSKYVVNCVDGDWSASSNLVKVERAKTLVQDVSAELNWIPGHSGEYLNELADALAKTSAEEQEEVDENESSAVQV